MFVLLPNVARTKLYYINTSEILGELSRENMIYSHAKIITCEKITLPWVPEVFLACDGNVRPGHYKREIKIHVYAKRQT